MRPQNKNKKAKPNSLEAVARRELGIELDKEHQGADWGGELSPEMIEYAATDAQVLLPLAEIFESKIEEASLERVFEIEHRALPAMVWMANAGVPLDAEGWAKYLERVEEEIERLKKELNAFAPRHPKGAEWNWNSHEQVKQAFELEGVRLPNVREETLSRCDHPLAELLLEYRAASKMVSHFGPNLLRFVQEDGRIYGDWFQIGTETGRMSCCRPNLQQLLPEIRRYLRAPEGRTFVWADYAQAEIRILAEASGEPVLIEAFKAGKDPYKATAARMFGVSEDEVTKEQRGAAKQINFGLIYGMSPKGLAKKLDTDVRAARALMNRYFDAHPRVAIFLEGTADEALRTGEARTFTGRVRRFGDATAMSGRQKRAVRRWAQNFPMQGACADGLKLALALLYERRHECPGAVPILALHDEIVVECDEGDIEKVKAWLEMAMKDGMSAVLDGPDNENSHVPVEVEVKTGKTWSE
jgi:DNA polymerase-1